MNVVVLIGRLVRDPEIRYTSGQTQTAIVNFRIAVDRRFKREGQPDADFFTASAFGKMAEFVGKYFHQGSKIVIQGRIQNDNYTDKNGNTVYNQTIIAENVEFGESKATAAQNASATARPAPGQKPDENGFMQIPNGIDEELPFA